MAEEFSAVIRFEKDEASLTSITSAIKAIGKDPIKLTIDTSSLKKQAGEAAEAIESTISNKLKDGGLLGKGSLFSKADINKITTAIDSVDKSIKQIQVSLGEVGKASGMKNIITSASEVSKSLENVKSQLKEIRELQSSGKDLKFDFGLGSNSFSNNLKYGQSAREYLVQYRQEIEKYLKLSQEYTQSVGKNFANPFVSMKSMMRDFGLEGFASDEGLWNRIINSSTTIGGSGSKNNLMQQVHEIGDAAEFLRGVFSSKYFDGTAIQSVANSFQDLKLDNVQAELQGIADGSKAADEQMSRLKNIFGGGFDDSQFEALQLQLKEIVETLQTISQLAQQFAPKLNTEGISTSAEDLLNVFGQIKTAMQTMDPSTMQAASAGIDHVVSSLNGFTIDIPAEQLSQMKDALADIGFGNSDIKKVTNELNSLGVSVENITTKIDGTRDRVEITARGVDSAGNKVRASISAFKELNKETNEMEPKVSDITTTISQNFTTATEEAKSAIRDYSETVTSGFANDRFAKDLSNVKSRFDAINEAIRSPELTQALTEYESALTNLDSAYKSGDVNEINNAYNNYKNTLEAVRNQLSINENAQKEVSRTERASASEASSAWASYKRTIDEIGRKRVRLVGLDKNSEEAKQLNRDIAELTTKASSLKAEMGNLSPKQIRELDDSTQKWERSVVDAQARVGDLRSTLHALTSGFKSSFTSAAAYMFSGYRVFSMITRGIRAAYQNVVDIDTAMTELKKVTDETASAYNRFLQDSGKNATAVGSTITDYINSTADFARLGYSFADSQELAKIANMYNVVGDDIDSIDEATQSIISTMKAFGVNAEDATSIVDKFNEVGNNFAISSGGIGEALQRSAAALAAANSTLDESIALVTAGNVVVQNPESVGTALKTLSARMRGAKTELEDMGEEVDEFASSTSKLRDEILALTGVDLMLDENTFKSPYAMLQELSKVWDELTDVSRANVLELLGGKRQANILASILKNFDVAEDALAKSADSAGSATNELNKYLDSIEAKTNQLKAAFQSLSKDFINSGLVKTGLTILTGLLKLVDSFSSSLGSFGTIGFFVALPNIIKLIGRLRTEFQGTIVTSHSFASAIANVSGGFTAFIKSGAGMVTAASAAITIISLLVSAIDRHIQKQREQNEALRKAGDDASESAKGLRELQDAYEESQKAYQGGTGSKAEYDAATKDLLSSLGYEEAQIDSLIVKYGSLTEAIEKETAAKKESNNSSLIAGIGGAERLLNEDNQHRINVAGEGSKDLIKLLKDNGFEVKTPPIVTVGNMSEGTSLGLSSDGRVAYEQLQKIRKLLEETYGEEARELELYNDINQELEKRKIHYESLTEQEKEYITGIAKDARDAFEDSFGEISSQSAFEMLFQSVSEKIVDSDIFEKSGINLESFLTEYFGGIAEYSDFVTEHVEANNKSAAKMIDALWQNTKRGDIDGEIDKMERAKRLAEEYYEIYQEIEDNGIDVGKTKYGNIDTNNRQILSWNENNLAKYKDAIKSWGASVDELRGSFSTVFGATENFDGVEIAFSPILQTDRGAELLDAVTVRRYINRIIEEAKARNGGESWTTEDLLQIDAEGINLYGKNIKGLIADVGDSAERTSEIMHYVGKDGAFASALREAKGAAEEYGVEISDLVDKNSNFTNSLNELKGSLSGLDRIRELVAKGILSGGEHASEILPWISELEDADKNIVFDIIVNTPDAAMWNLDQLQTKFNDIKSTSEGATNSLVAFNSLMADTSDGSFTQAIGSSQDRISKLLDARANVGKYQGMDAKFELVTDFPELAPYIDDTNALYDALTDLIDATYDGIDSRFEEEIANLGGAATESGAALASLQQMFHDVKHDYGIEGYSESSNQFAAVNTAVSNGFSGTGMKPEDIQAIISAYGKLDSYDPAVLFERTAQGVQVNTKALAILNRELVNSQKTGYRKYLQSLNQEYAELQGKLQSAHSTEEDSQWKARLGEIEQLTRAVADEAAAYDGLTSSFQAWQDAQKTGDQQDNYVSVYKGLEQTQALIDAGWGGNDDVLSYINHFLSAEQQVTSWGEVTEETWANITNTIGRYYGETAENLDTFLQDAMQAQGSMEWIKQLEDGSYEIDMDLGDIEQLATLMNENLDGVQISAENIQEIFNALKGSGAEITFSSDLDEPLQKTQTILDNIDEAKERSAEKTAYNLYADKAKRDTSGVLSNIREAIKEAQREKTINLDTNAAMNRLQELNNYLKSIKTDIRVNVYSGTVISNASNGVNAPGRNGPVYANGTAFARGSWGAKGSGIALGGELGREIVVRDGEWFTIGDNGAEFFRYQPDDIIFNAMQTQELLKYGGTRGRGESFASGTAFYTGVKGSYTAPKVKKKDNSKSSSKSSRSSSNNRSSNSRSSNSSTDKDFSETFDWIEVKIARIERAISNLDTKTNSVYRKWKNRNSYLVKEISKVNSEIDIQNKGYDRYIKEANSVGLSKKYRNKVKSGKIDIETIKNEKLAEKIKLYQQWYEKALACKDAMLELQEREWELYRQKFDNVVAQYDEKLALIQHRQAMIEQSITDTETHGYIVSKNYYNALAENEKEQIKNLTDRRKSMLNALNDAVKNGKIVRGSTGWNEMVTEINEVTQSIAEANTKLVEYSNNMRDIDWSIFDLLETRISYIADEADFLIKLMDNSKLFDDNGQLTNTGMATMGMHAQDYNVYMSQAQKYAEEIQRINKDIAEDPYNQTIVNRRQELLGLQRDVILSAESEKNAIQDMVKQGIDLELDALKSLIDSYNDALESQKDLYEQQKKTAEQTKKIASLEKQLAAYSGDNSEENRLRVQKIRNELSDARQELQESQYEQYISDQKEILDDFYGQYEDILNSRLDNLDLLVSDMIDATNANAETISDTIREESKKVGYDLTEEMQKIWSKESIAQNIPVLQTISDGILDGTTTLNTTIKSIDKSIKDMVKWLDDRANGDVTNDNGSGAENTPESSGKVSASTKSGSTSKKSDSKKTTDKKKSKDTKKKKSNGGDGKAKVGDYVTFKSGSYYGNSYGGGGSGSKNRGKKVYITKINSAKSAVYPYHISTGKRFGSGDLGWVKLSQLTGYASGKYNVFGDELAWTQERGREMIIRRSDGAVLTPLSRGDSVLNAQATKNIWDMANTPNDFILKSLQGANGIPRIAHGGAQVTQNFENVTFSMPNVRSYDEMLRQMQHDNNFEKLINSMTLDVIAGKSSFNKYKAIR